MSLRAFGDNETFQQLGSSVGVMALSPILLLLNEDGVVLTRLSTGGQRYAPLATAIPMLLTGKALASLLFSTEDHGSGSEGGIVRLACNLMGLGLTLPNHIFFSQFLWRHEQRDAFVLLAVTPLNVAALLMVSLAEVKVQAVCGVLFAVVQYFAARRIHREGMRML